MQNKQNIAAHNEASVKAVNRMVSVIIQLNLAPKPFIDMIKVDTQTREIEVTLRKVSDPAKVFCLMDNVITFTRDGDNWTCHVSPAGKRNIPSDQKDIYHNLNETLLGGDAEYVNTRLAIFPIKVFDIAQKIVEFSHGGDFTIAHNPSITVEMVFIDTNTNEVVIELRRKNCLQSAEDSLVDTYGNIPKQWDGVPINIVSGHRFTMTDDESFAVKSYESLDDFKAKEQARVMMQSSAHDLLRQLLALFNPRTRNMIAIDRDGYAKLNKNHLGSPVDNTFAPYHR